MCIRDSYSIFTQKNYGNTEMHWFWMVLVCVLLAFAWWKLRKFCKCPGPSSEEKRAKREAKWHKHQLDNIEKRIKKYERKLEEVRNLRSSLGLDGVTLNELSYSNDVVQNSDNWRTTWPVSIWPSQGAATWWRSPTPEIQTTFGEPDWYANGSPARQQTGWREHSPRTWTPPHGLTSTDERFEDVTVAELSLIHI